VIVALPILVPLLALSLMLVFKPAKQVREVFLILSSLVILLTGGYLLEHSLTNPPITLEFGNWKWPFGIVFVADSFSSLMIVITGIIGLATAVYGLGEELPESAQALSLVLLVGVSGAFLTSDLFNLYVWFEVLLLSSFVLLATGVDGKGFGGAFKYVLLNLISSLLFLTAVGLIYGRLGALNYHHIAQAIRQLPTTEALDAPLLLLACAFAIKGALAPFYFWLPASYHKASATISGLFAALLTKVGIYAIIRIFSIFPSVGNITIIFAVIAGLSMVVGIIGALGQDILRRLLAFHIISQVGYMVLGFAVGGKLALTGAIFYLVHHIIAKANLFLIAGIVEKRTGSKSLSGHGGMWNESYLVSFAFIFAAGSLAGIPPLSGFFAKFIVIAGAVDSGFYTLAVIAVLVGLGTLFSMVKVWEYSFWGAQVSDKQWDIPPCMVLVVFSLGVLSLLMGIFGGYIYDMSQKIAGELLSA
jgi:multicomponent Na+:H+ antiporter subunit D